MAAVLNSWKEVAEYMGRGVRTVQRWERELGLPIRRPKGRSRTAVVARSEELDAWLRRSPVLLEMRARRRDPAAHERILRNTRRLHEEAQRLALVAATLQKRLMEATKTSKVLLEQLARNGTNGK